MPPQDSELCRWFTEFLQPHEPMLRAWLQSRFSSSIEIDDLIQETFMKVLKAHDINELKSPKAFLFATARNLALDIVRRSKIIQFDSLPENELSDVIDVAESIARNEELELLTKAIQSLPSRCRRVFTLRKVYCMSQAAIAQKLGISINTVATQLKIGVRKCSAYMHEHSRK